MKSRLALVVAMLVLLSNCGDLTGPGGDAAFVLESINGQPLPLTLAVDYDLTVDLLDDEITLRSDSTFLEVARFRGTFGDETGDPMTIVYADSASGHYSITGGRLFLMLPNAAISQLEYDGAILILSGQRTFLYRRRALAEGSRLLQKALMKGFAMPARHPQLRAVLQDHHGVSGEPGLNLDHAIQIHDVPPMNPREVGGVQLPLELGRRRPKEVVRPAGV